MVRQMRFLIIPLVLALCAVMLACGCESKAQMQEFVDGYLRVMDQLESKPEVAQAGQQASMAYVNSGFTDLAAAEQARLSYVESSKNDAAGLAALAKVEAPDEKAEKIKSQLAEGVKTVGEGNKLFAESLAGAKDQTVEQRAAAASNIAEPMSRYVAGMSVIVASLEGLKEYIKTNSLEGASVADGWYQRINGELEGVKQYQQQQ